MAPLGGSAPKPPGFIAFVPRYWLSCSRRSDLPKGGRCPSNISAAESALGAHPCVALSSARPTYLIDGIPAGLSRHVLNANSVTNHAGQPCYQSSRHLRHSCRRRSRQGRGACGASRISPPPTTSTRVSTQQTESLHCYMLKSLCAATIFVHAALPLISLICLRLVSAEVRIAIIMVRASGATW